MMVNEAALVTDYETHQHARIPISTFAKQAEMDDWCWDTFGNPAHEGGTQWEILGNGGYAFALESDKLIFLLRWS